METVRHQGHRISQVAHNELHQHEAPCHGQHAKDSWSCPTAAAARDSRKFHPQPGALTVL